MSKGRIVLVVALACCVASMSCDRDEDGAEKVTAEGAEPNDQAGAKSSSPQADEPDTDKSRDEGGAQKVTDEVERLSFGDELPEGVERNGELITGLRWADKSGEHILVFHHEERAHGEELLRGDHLRAADGEWSLVEDYKELAKDCDGADLTMDPIIGPWSVTDLDEDGHAEVTFAWQVGCRTDVSPVTHKVLMIEEGEKYGLRGTSTVRVGKDEWDGGSLKVGEAFEDANAEFLTHAKEVWRKTVEE